MVARGAGGWRAFQAAGDSTAEKELKRFKDARANRTLRQRANKKARAANGGTSTIVPLVCAHCGRDIALNQRLVVCRDCGNTFHVICYRRHRAAWPCPPGADDDTAQAGQRGPGGADLGAGCNIYGPYMIIYGLYMVISGPYMIIYGRYMIIY